MRGIATAIATTAIVLYVGLWAFFLGILFFAFAFHAVAIFPSCRRTTGANGRAQPQQPCAAPLELVDEQLPRQGGLGQIELEKGCFEGAIAGLEEGLGFGRQCLVVGVGVAGRQRIELPALLVGRIIGVAIEQVHDSAEEPPDFLQDGGVVRPSAENGRVGKGGSHC